MAVAASAAVAELDVAPNLTEVGEHASIGGMPLKIASNEAPIPIGRVKENPKGSTKEDTRKLQTMAASFVSDSDTEIVALRNSNTSPTNQRGTNRAKTQARRHRNNPRGKNRGRLRDARLNRNQKANRKKWKENAWGGWDWDNGWGDGWNTDWNDGWGGNGWDDGYGWESSSSWSGKSGKSGNGGWVGKAGKGWGGKAGKGSKGGSRGDDWVDPWFDDWNHDDWIKPWDDWNGGEWKDDWGSGWNDWWTAPPTLSPTTSPTLYPTFYPTLSPTTSVSNGVCLTNLFLRICMTCSNFCYSLLLSNHSQRICQHFPRLIRLH